MAARYGVNYTASQPGPSFAPIGGGDSAGDLRRSYDEYTTIAGMTSSDTIDMGRASGALRPGDRVVGARIACGALGAGVTLALGDDGNASRFISATSGATAAIIEFNQPANYGWQVDQARPLRVTIGGAAPAAGQKISVTLDVLRS